MNSVDKAVCEIFAPRKLKPPVAWLYENCVLRDSENPGSFRAFPYCEEPLNNFVDPMVSKITLCFGSQAGKTSHMYGGLAYLLVEFPKDTLYIMPSAENARNFSKGRWLPFIDDCAPLKANCPLSPTTGRIDSDRITNMRQEFLTCTMTFAGAGSENNVKSAPVAYLVMDEIDEIDQDIQQAALERVKGRREFKIIQTSTPKEEDDGIWKEYLNGDQRKYHVHCPHCSELIKLEWRQKDKEGKIRFSIAFDESAKLDDGTWDYQLVASTAHYRCPCCDGKILDAHKPDMLKGGEWIPENPAAPPGHRSYHLSSLYAPAITFSGLMVKWLQAQGSISRIKKFIQGDLAEPWREEAMNTEEAEAEELEGEYERGDLKGEYRIISADTQTDHFRFVVRGFDRDGNNYLVDYGQCASFRDLDEKYEIHKCAKGIIDCAGDRTQEIYEEIYKRRTRWFGSRGWDKRSEPYTLQHKDPVTGDKRGRGGQSKILYLHIDKQVFEAEMSMLRTRKMGGFFTFAGTGKDYYKELFATYWTQETDKNGYKKIVRKVKRHRQDHYWDCEIMARALSKFLGIARADRDNLPAVGEAAPRKPKNRASRQRSSTSFWS